MLHSAVVQQGLKAAPLTPAQFRKLHPFEFLCLALYALAEAARLFVTAFRDNDCKAVRLYTKRGYDCSCVDPITNFTLLHLIMCLPCTDCDKSSMAQSLIKAGNPVDARDKKGMTPLMHCRSTTLAAVLLDHGADINADSEEDSSSRFTCLTHAVANDKLPVVQLLLSRGASVDAGVASCGTSLFLACNLGHLAIAKALLASGAHVTGQQLLHGALFKVAASGAHLELLRVLLQYHAPVEEVDAEGMTPLMQCVKQSAGCCAASMLIEAGADVNARQTGGGGIVQLTALHYAAYIQSADMRGMLRELLAAGASADALCSNHCLPLHTALRDNCSPNPEVGSSLCMISCICHLAACNGNTKLVSYHYLQQQVFKNVELLLKAMDPALINTYNKEGCTPLLFAVEEQRGAEIISLLIKHGADVHARCHKGRTPLFSCAEPAVTRVLLEAGADVNARD
jgi:ankyrin repeat protein